MSSSKMKTVIKKNQKHRRFLSMERKTVVISVTTAKIYTSVTKSARRIVLTVITISVGVAYGCLARKRVIYQLARQEYNKRE